MSRQVRDVATSQKHVHLGVRGWGRYHLQHSEWRELSGGRGHSGCNRLAGQAKGQSIREIAPDVNPSQG